MALDKESEARGSRYGSIHWASDVLDDATIALNELGIDAVQIDVRRPGSFFGVPVSSGLGWGVGAALGAKLVNSGRIVVVPGVLRLCDGVNPQHDGTPCRFQSSPSNANR